MNPQHLSDRAKKRWKELEPKIGPHLHDLLAVYCEAYADWREASEKVVTQGRLVKDARNNVVPTPWIGIRDNAAKTMHQAAQVLGLAFDGDILPDQEDNPDIADIRARDPNLAKAMQALYETGGNIAAASRKMGISRQTFYVNYFHTSEMQALAPKIREHTVDLAEDTILRLIKAGDREASRYMLRCFGKDRGWVESYRLEGQNGGPILTEHTTRIVMLPHNGRDA